MTPSDRTSTIAEFLETGLWFHPTAANQPPARAPNSDVTELRTYVSKEEAKVLRAMLYSKEDADLLELFGDTLT